MGLALLFKHAVEGGLPRSARKPSHFFRIQCILRLPMRKTTEPKENRSGRIWVENDAIRYTLWPDQAQLPISKIRVLGEWTNENGPCGDDYFFSFIISDPQIEWWEVSFYAEGQDELLSDLGKRWSADLKPELCNSTTFKSRTMWPQELEGLDLFRFEQVQGKGLFGKVKNWIIPSIENKLSPEILAFLAR